MARKPFVFAMTAMFLLFSAPVMAGGPPWLCLPVDGVTVKNVDACAEMVAAKLKSKVYQPEGKSRAVHIQQRSDQWNMMFYLTDDVRLSDIEAALKSSGLSIPRDRLHLFGHLILEINTSTTSSKELLKDLEKLDFVSVVSAEAKENRLLAIVDMPYPTQFGRPESEPVQWAIFQRNNLASDQSTTSEGTATPEKLPSYRAFVDLMAKHNAKLKDIRWSTDYACRPVGGVAVPDSDRIVQATQTQSD